MSRMIWALAGVLTIFTLTSCVTPESHAPLTRGSRGAGSRVLYLPSVASSPLPARLYLPGIARQARWKLFLPIANRNYPICTAFGGDCVEPNDSRTLAVPLAELNRPYYGTVYTGTLDAYDFYVVSLTANKPYTVTLSGGGAPGTPFVGQDDADLYLYDAIGMQLRESTAYGQVAEWILFTPTLSGPYYLLAFGYFTPVGPANYRLEVRDRP